MIYLPSILTFISNKTKSLGQGLVYTTMLLYYAWHQPDTPHWAKKIIFGAVAYLVSPIDSIPDLTPFLGFTDDMSVLSVSLMTIACYINDDVKAQAQRTLKKSFKKVNLEVVEVINNKL